MKIWITRSSARSLQFGGLERVFVWFRKPVWYSLWRDTSKDDTFIGEVLSDKNGRLEEGWKIIEGGSVWIDHSVSFGKLFGYGDREDMEENNLADFVWSSIQTVFNNKPFEDWDEIEDREKILVKDFLLELDIAVSLRK